MNIYLQDTGKRFNREWIFRHVHYTFSMGESYAVCGPNGCGKSTFLQTIAGAIVPTEGTVYYSNSKILPDPALQAKPYHTALFHQVAYVAPYLELIEEMTAAEFLSFHAVFKPFSPKFTQAEILDTVGLGQTGNKQIRYFSSGMKQRLKLAQGFYANVPVLLLDEPCTNLDAEGYALYERLIQTFAPEKIMLIGSNDPREYSFCTKRITITDYKS